MNCDSAGQPDEVAAAGKAAVVICIARISHGNLNIVRTQNQLREFRYHEDGVKWGRAVVVERWPESWHQLERQVHPRPVLTPAVLQ